MQSQDIFYIVASVCAIFISVPLMLVLWRTYTMLEKTNKVLEYIDHLRELALQFESVPLKVIESILGNLTSRSSGKK